MLFNIFNTNSNDYLNYVVGHSPNALAQINGREDNKSINGTVAFYNTPTGVLVYSKIYNLPKTETNIFAEHVHEYGDCSGDFTSAGEHYNPSQSEHPLHAGDMPPLFSMNGTAVSLFLTNRFKIPEIIGKSVIIHSGVDDFTTQPSGNSGSRIACGVIK